MGVLNGTVYYQVNFNSICKIPTGTIASGYWPRSCAVDSDAIYFVDLLSRSVMRLSSSEQIIQIIDSASYERTIFIDANYLYETGNGSITRYDKTGQNTIVLINSTTALGKCSDGEYVYFVDNNFVKRISVTGGFADTLSAVQTSNLSSIVVDDKYIYWSEQGSGLGQGKIFKLSKTIPFGWTLMTNQAQWTKRQLLGTAAFNGKLWMISGSTGPGVVTKDIWYSSDGVTWEQQLPLPPWQARNAPTTAVFMDKLWLMGGWSGGTYPLGDIWLTSDGINWAHPEETSGDVWGQRVGHAAVVYDDKLWVIGGNYTDVLNDVYYTGDGANWVKTTSNAQWHPRYFHTAAAFGGKLWVLGGYDGTLDKQVNDVWWSTDGITWTAATMSAAWEPREGHTTLVYDDKLWVLGGIHDSTYLNDVWWSSDGINWHLSSGTPWTARAYFAAQVFQNSMWIFGGRDSLYKNDVWRSVGSIGDDKGYEYTYDTVSRLTAINPNNGVHITYDYDPAGNRLQKRVYSDLEVSVGPANPSSGGVINSASDHSMIQLTLTNNNVEDFILRSLTFAASGSGNESTAISSAKLWMDANADGAMDGGDTQLGSDLTFSSDNGSLAFTSVNQTLAASSSTYLLVAYTLNGSASQGQTFTLYLPSSTMVKVDVLSSGVPVSALGKSITGATITISNDTNPPTFAGVTSAVGNDGSITLGWAAATDPSTPITYAIWHSTTSFGGSVSGEPAYTTTDTTYTVPNLINGQEYFFVVRAQDAAGNRDTNTVELSAVPQATLYTLTLNTGPNGSVSIPTGITPFEKGTSVTIAAMADSGYRFLNWTGDVPVGAETINPLMVILDANKALTANFTKSTGTVVVVVSPIDAPWTLTDGDGVLYPEQSGPATVNNVPTGQITLAWTPLSGYVAPASPVSQTLATGGVVTFTGVYEVPPIASFTASAERGVAPLSVHFTDTSEPGTKAIASWLWSFGDGQTSPEQDPDHVYATPGAYPVTLTVTTAAGSDISDSLTIRVGAVVAFGADMENQYGYATETVQFKVTPTGGLGTLQYHWKFDNGQKAISDVGDGHATLTLDSLGPQHIGSYWCEVTDEIPLTYYSNHALLEVQDHVKITTPPEGGTKTEHDSHRFYAEAQGGYAPLTYTWVKDGFDVASGQEYTIDSLNESHKGDYKVIVTDIYGDFDESDAVTLNVMKAVPISGLIGVPVMIAILSLSGAMVIRHRGRKKA